MKDYGITNVKFGDDDHESTMIQFGDGKTGIQSLGYDDGNAGIVICRDGKHSTPFGFNADRDTYKSSQEKVFISFDNVRSIDVMIDRLIEAREFLVSN